MKVLLTKDIKIEFIIIDGKSEDKTLSIINNYKNKISKIISGKDDGIYDAFNKGLKEASGDLIGFVTDDVLTPEIFRNTSKVL